MSGKIANVNINLFKSKGFKKSSFAAHLLGEGFCLAGGEVQTHVGLLYGQEGKTVNTWYCMV